MKNSNKAWDKFFIAFGIITVLSGIYLTLQENYLIGISVALRKNETV